MIISQKQINKQKHDDLIMIILYGMIYVLFTFNIHYFIMKQPGMKEEYELYPHLYIG